MAEIPPRSTFVLTTLVPTLLLALGVGGLYAMYSRNGVSQTSQRTKTIPLVETISVLPHQGGIDLQVDGVVTPYREIELSAEVAGRIIVKSGDCRAGQFVTKGTLLLEIDPRDYELELQRLAELQKQADASLAECDVETANIGKLIDLSREEHELQKREMNRVQRMKAGTVSEADIDKSKRGEWNSRNNLLTLENQLQLVSTRRRGLENARELVGTQIKKAELDLKRTRVVSPADGIVVRDAVEQDSFVQKGALLAIVEDTSKVEVRCNLKMDDLVWLWQQSESASDQRSPLKNASGDEIPALKREPQRSTSAPSNRKSAVIVASAAVDPPDSPAASVSASSTLWRPHYELPRTPVTVSFRLQGSSTRFSWKGTLTRFDGSGLDEKTRTVPSRVIVDDPRAVVVEGNSGVTGPRALVRGMYVSVLIHASPQVSFLRVPESAVHPGKMVLRVRANKLDIVGPLQLVRLMDEASGNGEPHRYWIVHPNDTDLAASDKIVVSPLPTAHSGMEVREHAGR